MSRGGRNKKEERDEEDGDRKLEYDAGNTLT
jgi:hypothetical protein